MDRKGFLKVLWFKLFIPIILIGVLIFSIQFLIRIFTQNGFERFISIIAIGFVILSILSFLFGLVLRNLTNRIKSKLSDETLQTIMIIGKIIDYILPIALGMMIYYSWQKNGTFAIAFFGTFLILKIIDIVKKEKLATTSGICNAEVCE